MEGRREGKIICKEKRFWSSQARNASPPKGWNLIGKLWNPPSSLLHTTKPIDLQYHNSGLLPKRAERYRLSGVLREAHQDGRQEQDTKGVWSFWQLYNSKLITEPNTATYLTVTITRNSMPEFQTKFIRYAKCQEKKQSEETKQTSW